MWVSGTADVSQPPLHPSNQGHPCYLGTALAAVAKLVWRDSQTMLHDSQVILDLQGGDWGKKQGAGSATDTFEDNFLGHSSSTFHLTSYGNPDHLVRLYKLLLQA
jgi:hypothetical protein